MFWKTYHKKNLSQENTYAGVSFSRKLQAVGLELYQNETAAQVLPCESLRSLCRKVYYESLNGFFCLKLWISEL